MSGEDQLKSLKDELRDVIGERNAALKRVSSLEWALLEERRQRKGSNSVVRKLDNALAGSFDDDQRMPSLPKDNDQLQSPDRRSASAQLEQEKATNLHLANELRKAMMDLQISKQSIDYLTDEARTAKEIVRRHIFVRSTCYYVTLSWHNCMQNRLRLLRLGSWSCPESIKK